MSQPASPTRGEQEGGLCLRRRKTQVRRHGDDRAGADADTVDGGNDRLAATDHRLDQIAGHAGEGEQVLHVHLHQRTDDVMDIAARAEIAAIGGEDDDIDIAGVDQSAEHVAQFGITVEGQRILAIGPVKTDSGDAVLHVPKEVLRLEAGEFGHDSSLRIRLRMPVSVSMSSSERLA